MKKFASLLCLTIISAVLISACGQKGALYYPDENPSTTSESRSEK